MSVYDAPRYEAFVSGIYVMCAGGSQAERRGIAGEDHSLIDY